MRPPVPRDPQLYHGIGDKPMDDASWKMAKESDKWLRKPLLVPGFRAKVISIMDRIKAKQPRYRFKAIAIQHIERFKQVEAA